MANLYKIQEAGGAGRCFFNSIHDSILSRENEFAPKKGILQGIYECFGINMGPYTEKQTDDEKKIQFNRDIRTFLAAKIRQEPSGFQDMAKEDFLRMYGEANNKAPLEQTRERGEADKNAYPGYYDILSNPLVYDEMTANNELFELQRAGAVSPARIEQMGRRGFYTIMAQTLEDQNYSTYAMAPAIFLLNYYLSNCKPEGYFITIIYPTQEIQPFAKNLTVNHDGNDLISIPVYKTYGAHYQAIVKSNNKDEPVQRGLYALQAKKQVEQYREKATKEIETILADAMAKDAQLKDELTKQKERRKLPRKVRQKSLVSSMPLYSIEKDFFEVGKFYKSVEKADGIPIVETFEVNGIQGKGANAYELSITMMDGTKTSILIDNKEGHFVTYEEVSTPKANSKSGSSSSSSVSSGTKSKEQSSVLKPKTKEEFTAELKKRIGEDYFVDLSLPVKKAEERLSLEDFRKKIGQKGGFIKGNSQTKKKRRNKKKQIKQTKQSTKKRSTKKRQG